MTGALSQLTPADWITAHARVQGDHPCLVDGLTERAWTFAEINARTNRLARSMAAAGLERGDRIGVLDTDSVDYMVLLLASLKLGTTYVPLNYRLNAEELTTLVDFADLSALFIGRRYAELLPRLRAAAPRVRLVAGTDDVDPSLPSIDDLVKGSDDDSDITVPTEWEDVVALLFTSGTTGRPKGVMQSLRMINAVTQSGIIDFRLRRDEFRYSASPMFHVAGMGCIYYGIARGFTSLVLPQFEAKALARWLGKGITGFLAMPTMISSLLDEPGVHEREYPALRSIAYGGAPMPPALLRRLIDVFDCGFFNSFGAGTEAGGQAMFYPEDHLTALDGREHLLGSIGRPMFGVDLRLVDDGLNDVPRGEIGEICTRSESVMSGYFKDPELTAEVVQDGWFRAGDMAWMDDDGYLFLAARKSDMIIRGGENVYPVEIESVLAEHAAVRDVAVVGCPDAHWGEIVVAAVTFHEGTDADTEDLREHCRHHLAAYKVPSVIHVFDHLPTNASGKVMKHRLEELLPAPEDPAPANGNGGKS